MDFSTILWKSEGDLGGKMSIGGEWEVNGQPDGGGGGKDKELVFPPGFECRGSALIRFEFENQVFKFIWHVNIVHKKPLISLGHGFPLCFPTPTAYLFPSPSLDSLRFTTYQ